MWSKGNEVYIQNLISIEYTSTDWLSIVLVITIIRSGKQIGSKLPKNGVCIEMALNSTSFLKKEKWIIHKNLRTSTLVSNKFLAIPPHSCLFQQLVATFLGYLFTDANITCLIGQGSGAPLVCCGPSSACQTSLDPLGFLPRAFYISLIHFVNCKHLLHELPRNWR